MNKLDCYSLLLKQILQQSAVNVKKNIKILLTDQIEFSAKQPGHQSNTL